MVGSERPSDLHQLILLDLISSSSFADFDAFFRNIDDEASAVCVMEHRQGGEVLVGLALMPSAEQSSDDLIDLVCIRLPDERVENSRFREQAKRLELQNKHLRDLTSLAIHNIRNRLQTVCSNAELIRIHLAEHEVESVSKRVDHIQTASDNVKNLLVDVEKSIRFEIGTYPSELTNLNVMVDKIVDEASCDRGTPVSIRRVDTLPSIVCEQPLVREIFMNLVENAIKYSDKDVIEIEIGLCEVEPTKPVFYVKDNGVGIAPADISKVFKAFGRADRLGLNHEGSGMGMALSRKIVERHGGTIALESTVGVGTTVKFSLSEE